tara:strand:+ start:136 stop:321 length:186 start_codon:yes stop_codon:yes gene_type:complete
MIELFAESREPFAAFYFLLPVAIPAVISVFVALWVERDFYFEGWSDLPEIAIWWLKSLGGR